MGFPRYWRTFMIGQSPARRRESRSPGVGVRLGQVGSMGAAPGMGMGMGVVTIRDRWMEIHASAQLTWCKGYGYLHTWPTHWAAVANGAKTNGTG